MSNEISIDEIAAEIGANASESIPEATSAGSTSEFLAILRENSGKWISSAMVTAVYKRRGMPTKYISNKMNALGKREDVEVEKRNGRNWFRYSA